MSDAGTSRDSLRAALDALHAERVATWTPEALHVNVEQRAILRDGFDPARAIRAGATFPDFALDAVDGTRHTAASLTANGFAVLVIFRFATCPACNVAIPYYARTLAPALAARGVALAAISPQPVERLVEIRDRHGLDFPVLSDSGNALGRSLGILYTFSDAARDAAERNGASPVLLNGTANWELPMPAAFVIDRDRTVRYAAISPDWMDRAETADILAGLDAALQSRAA